MNKKWQTVIGMLVILSGGVIGWYGDDLSAWIQAETSTQPLPSNANDCAPVAEHCNYQAIS